MGTSGSAIRPALEILPRAPTIVLGPIEKSIFPDKLARFLSRNYIQALHDNRRGVFTLSKSTTRSIQGLVDFH